MQYDIQGDLAFLQAAGVLKSLLADKTTGRHILWGTDAYRERGPEYARDQEIEIGLITGEASGLLKTRAQKAAEQQTERTRQHAEVFTPAWICRMMNNQADAEWFGREEVFFRKDGEPTERVDFKKKSWKRYVDSKRLEITCGEAPYLVSRYDVSSGEPIPLNHRAGLLDRKLRVVNEHTETEADWLKWAFRAYEATYGYEFQGDNLLIARVNLMMTFGEYLKARWQRQPTLKEWKRLARTVVWNIWQMDGLTCALPYAKGHDMAEQTEFLSAFGFEPPQEEGKQPYCRIYLWRYLKSSMEFRRIKEGADGMKFDFIIGNPPYQDDIDNKGDRANPVYDKFMDECYTLSDVVELIHPARFLFDAGQTPKDWNKKMLSDPHFKVLHYMPKSDDVFVNVDIMGGIAITYRNQLEYYGAIVAFSPFFELNSILHKVKKVETKFLDSFVSSRGMYRFSERFYKDYPDASTIVGKGSGNMIVSNAFEKLNQVFFSKKPSDNANYLQMFGRESNRRTFKFIKREYVNDNQYTDYFKILVPEANGSGAIGEVSSTPLIGEPVIGNPQTGVTDTFLCIGIFDNSFEAENALKYIKTKFSRVMLGICKVTQHNPKSTWKYVPLQDFTPSSDIDWSQSIPDIDRQLYAKYGLDENEIAFIESHVKEMV